MLPFAHGPYASRGGQTCRQGQIYQLWMEVGYVVNSKPLGAEKLFHSALGVTAEMRCHPGSCNDGL